MSGDVQPRKRKDKKKKKDELTLEDSRGTAAALGEGDVFLHSHSDHGTGGHWCAKIIFFSLLAVLITLIGLIIIENRGLSELEANSVQSSYSGILEGWIEDVPDDDHHDIHTLELKHHEDEHEEEDEDDDDHDDGFEDGGSEEDEDTLDHNEDEEDSQELDTADTEEVENGINHDEDEDDGEDSELNDVDEESEKEVMEPPVESFFDYFFGSQKPQEDVLSDEDRDEENEIEGDDDDNDNDDNENGDAQYENNVDDTAYSNDDDEDDNGDNDDNGYNIYHDDENYNSHQNNYDEENDDDDDYLNQNDASTYQKNDAYENEDDNNEWELNENNDNDLELQHQNLNDNFEQEEDDDHDDDDDDDDDETEEVEVEKIEEEVDDQEPIDVELPPLPEDDDDDSADEKNKDGDSNANDDDDDDDNDGDDDDDDDDDDDFLEHDDIFEEPIVERISVPAGKPYAEVDEDDSTEQTPANTLAEEEEYERQQEELRKEQAEASHVWLKLGVGAALLVATHAVIKRATARDEGNSEENEDREDTPPTIDRRMTLITEPANDDLETQEAPISRLERQVFQQIPHIVKSAPTPLQVSMDDEIEVEEDYEQQAQEEEEREEEVVRTKTPEVELYSDEEIEENIEPIKEKLTFSAFKRSPQPVEEKELPSDEELGDEEEVDDDVEIIGDEQIDEEEVEELDDEDISDVDDAELLSRLEAKYGSLSDPEKPKHKDGGDSVDDAWPGEPDDPFWKKEVDKAEDELEQGQWSAAIGRALSPQLAKSSRARYIAARAYDQLAEEKRDNKILSIAISAYVELMKNADRISDKKLLEITNRTIERMHFRGTYISTEPIHRLLIRRFPDNVGYRTNLTVSFLMANRIDLAEEVLKETLQKWPNDRVALAQYGFILKTQHNRLEDALEHLTKALENDTGPATEPRFYYHLGDTLLLLGRFEEAHEVHKRAAKYGHFLSPSQRSLYNVKRLKGKPWWNVNETPYERLAKTLEQNWRAILKEGLAAKALYEEEKEGLREKGEWSQLDLFVRGAEVGGRCARAPVTCAAVRAEPAAVGCRRGQVKFSAIEPGTHVRAHVGPTNCRLRMHLGLSNTENTYLRVDRETRQWQEGKVFIFDDSFEHEVWHNGTGSRLVLIVDVWHPDLTPQERRTLPAI